MRTTFSASESSAASTSPVLTRQGTGWSASSTLSSTSACMTLRRRPPAATAKRSMPFSSGSSVRTTRFSSSPRAAMEALSSASARGSGGVLRTFSGASASRLSGISRMSGSALGAMKFMRISLEGCEHAARGGPLRPPRAHPNGGPAPAPGGATRRSPAPEAGGRRGTAVWETAEEGARADARRRVALRGAASARLRLTRSRSADSPRPASAGRETARRRRRGSRGGPCPARGRRRRCGPSP